MSKVNHQEEKRRNSGLAEDNVMKENGYVWWLKYFKNERVGK